MSERTWTLARAEQANVCTNFLNEVLPSCCSQEACHTCISSATNIVLCLASVAVSHTSLSVRRRARMLVWRHFFARNGYKIGTRQVSSMRAKNPRPHAWCPPTPHWWKAPGPQRLERPLTPNRDEATGLSCGTRQKTAPTSEPRCSWRCHTTFAEVKRPSRMPGTHDNAFVSWDHLPPTSPATTTNRARPSR